MSEFPNFHEAIEAAKASFAHAEIVHTERWQGIDISKRPEAAMHEVRYFHFSAPMDSEELDVYRDQIQPNLPWADDHFLERVCGFPINPGKEWANWPFGLSADKFRKDQRFNHNYMERYWPKFAGIDRPTITPEDYAALITPETEPLKGIRYRYGDLDDLIEQLYREPYTRQAYLPIFFPEDTGVANPDRKPCTLGYFFLMRNNRLDVTYYIRSCDFVRHFRDDIYLTIRLVLWVLSRLRLRDLNWANVKPGLFRMDIGSLHMFRNDYIQMFRK